MSIWGGSNGNSSTSEFSFKSDGTKKLVHHNIYKENKSQSLIRWLSPSEFKWDLSGASWITETQTYYLVGDDGAFCMVQMAYSNLTWPNTSCQVTARYYKPGIDFDAEESSSTSGSSAGVKAIHRFETQTVSSLRMKLADDNTSCSLQTSSITMKSKNEVCQMSGNSRGKDFTFQINYSITPPSAQQPSPFTLNLDFEPECAPFQIKEGKIHFGATKGDGFIDMKFIPSGRCSGIICIEGEIFDFKGTGICLRQFNGVRPHLTTKRWNCAYFREMTKCPDAPVRSLFIIQMQSSSAYDDENVQYGFYFDGEKLKAVTSTDNEINYTKSVIDKESGYEVPEHFDYRWKGVDVDGVDFDAKISGTPTARMARIDLLENLPIFLRKIVEGICSARPYIYQNFNQGVEAVINGEKVYGHLFQEFSFVLNQIN